MGHVWDFELGQTSDAVSDDMLDWLLDWPLDQLKVIQMVKQLDVWLLLLLDPLSAWQRD